METEQDYEPKLSPIEGYAMIATAAFFDAVDIGLTMLDLMIGVGEVLKPFNDAVASCTLLFWVILKGIGPMRTAAGGALELVPFVNALPMRTVMAAITVHLDRHPAEAEIASTATRVLTPKRPPRPPSA